MSLTNGRCIECECEMKSARTAVVQSTLDGGTCSGTVAIAGLPEPDAPLPDLALLQLTGEVVVGEALPPPPAPAGDTEPHGWRATTDKILDKFFDDVRVAALHEQVGQQGRNMADKFLDDVRVAAEASEQPARTVLTEAQLARIAKSKAGW